MIKYCVSVEGSVIHVCCCHYLEGQGFGALSFYFFRLLYCSDRCWQWWCWASIRFCLAEPSNLVIQNSFPHENILDHAGNEDIVGDTLNIDDNTESVGDKSTKGASKYPPIDPTVRLFKKLTINFEASVYYNMISLIKKTFYQCKVKAVMIWFNDWRKVHLNLIMNATARMLRDILNWLQKPPVLSVAIWEEKDWLETKLDFANSWKTLLLKNIWK